MQLGLEDLAPDASGDAQKDQESVAGTSTVVGGEVPLSEVTAETASTDQTWIRKSNQIFWQFCNVCLSKDMPAGGNKEQCKCHTKTIESMTTSLKEMDTKNGNTEKFDEFTQMRETAPPYPPSAFANNIREFGTKFPSKGGKRQTRPQHR